MKIVESGRIVAIERDGVWVETIRSSACGSCAARSGCGHRTLAGALTSDKGLVRAAESARLAARNCSVNDTVEISIPKATLAQGALVLYGVPLFVGTSAAALAAGHGDLESALAFFFALALAFLGLRWLDAHALLGAHEPQLERVLGPEVEPVTVVTAER